jgi:Flp pilus assembly protein TadD
LKSASAEVQLAYVYLNQKRYREADALFKRNYIPGAHDLRVLSGMVDVNLAQSRGQDAIELIRNDLKRSSSPVGVHELLAETQLRLGQHDAAIKELKQLVEEQPSSTAMHAKLADAYRLAGDAPNAIAEFQKAADLAPNQTGPNVMLGYLLARVGRTQEAKARYERALAAAPDDPILLNNLAALLADSGGDLAEGMRHAQRALSKDPENPQMKDTVGWIYAKMKNSGAAVQILDTLTRKYPKNPTFRYHLGYAMLQSGQKEQARNQLTIALSNKPEKEDEEAIKKLLASIGS